MSWLKRLSRSARVTVVLCAVATVLLLSSCEELGLTPETAAPRFVQDEIRLPADYQLEGERFEDNSQSTPIRTYTASVGPPLKAGDLQLPTGYRRNRELEAKLEEGKKFEEAWDLVGYWEGPAPGGDGVCNVIVAFEDQQSIRRAEVEVACVLGPV